MWGLMHVWDCPNCGQRLDDQIEYNSPIIDTVNDRVEHANLCSDCGAEVTQRMSEGSNGEKIPVMHEVDEGRMYEFAYGDEDEDYEDDTIFYLDGED